MNIIEYTRKLVIEEQFETNFENAFEVWTNYFSNYFNDSPNAVDILNLGDKLADLFETTTEEGRGQGTVSNAGNAWEMLVCWYLNLCSIGSRMVVIRKISNLPDPLRDGISVNYGNIKCNTESDLVVVIFPDEDEVWEDVENLSFTNTDGEQIEPFTRYGNLRYKELGNAIGRKYFDDFELGIIQCKTNWNDNAQIPMLWNMVYQSEDFEDNQITIGRNNFTIKDLENFSYSFVTVPTVDLDKFSPTSVAVQRVRNLSGGNYWGNPSGDGIARNIKEIFNNNFSNAFDPNLRRSLEQEIDNIETTYDYFRLLFSSESQGQLL